MRLAWFRPLVALIALAPLAAPSPALAQGEAQQLPPSTAPTAAPTPRPVATAPATAPQNRNELIQGIVDRYRVSGVRAAGADSKALVDGHVYKINEVIDRTIGLKLVKVEADHLTFVDAQGDTYLKSF